MSVPIRGHRKARASVGSGQKLLSLLVAGVADKSIAPQMELSRHTVQRDVQQTIRLADDATSVLSRPGRRPVATDYSTDTRGH
jgi:hypothetical protein